MPAQQLISFDYAMKYILRDKSDWVQRPINVQLGYH